MNPVDSATQQVVTDAELEEFAAVARRFADEVTGPAALQLDKGDAEAIGAAWQGLCEIGFDRCLATEAVGGAELPLRGLLTILEELGAGDSGIALLALLANCGFGVLAEESQSALPAGGRAVFIPFANPDGKNAPLFDGGSVDGEVVFALGAPGADRFVVACRQAKSPAESMVLVAIDPQGEGVAIEPGADQLGLLSAGACGLRFNAAAGSVVGGAEELETALLVLNAGLAAIAHGVARRARRLAQDYAENRYQGGGMIIEYGAVREMLAAIVEGELATTGLAAGADGAPPSLAGALARKCLVTDFAVGATIDAVQVCGGMGYMHETGLEKLMRDAKYLQLYPVANWHAREQLLESTRA